MGLDYDIYSVRRRKRVTVTESLEQDVVALVKNYGLTRNDSDFTDIFNLVSPVLHRRITTLAAKYFLDAQDVESLSNEKLFEVVQSYDESKGPFFKYLNTAIKYGCCDLCREQKIEDKKEITFVSTDNEDFSDKLAPTSETTAEEDAITKIQKECEQRQLLANLIDNVDADTRQSISAYLDGGSYGKAAKLISVDKKTIQRRIKRLARKFDANQMGQITDYFTVPTVKVI